MRLKIITSAFFVLGVLLMLGWPLIVGSQPDPLVDGAEAMRGFALRAVIYFGVMLVTFFATVVCAWLLVRQTRREFQDQSLGNLHNLIEETLKDHGSKR